VQIKDLYLDCIRDDMKHCIDIDPKVRLWW